MTILPRRGLKAGRSKAGLSKAGRVGLLLSVSLGVAHCAAPPTAPAPGPAIASQAAPAPASLPPASLPAAASGVATGPGTAPDANGKPVLFNDPPARPDTPLCGRQAREANAIGATLQGPRVAASGICASFACYDPLTATYIGADGYRHVCR